MEVRRHPNSPAAASPSRFVGQTRLVGNTNREASPAPTPGVQVSQEEPDRAGVRPRSQRFLPHLGALIAGGAALWGWARLLDAHWLESGLAQIVYLVMLVFAPIVGASVVAYSQRTALVEERHQVLIPYIWWAAAGLLGVLLFVLMGASAGSAGSAPPVFRIAFLAPFVLVWWVPVVVPLLRAIMWLVSPPVIDRDNLGTSL